MRSNMIRIKWIAGLYLINNVKNGKILEPHALGDTPIPSRGYGRVHH